MPFTFIVQLINLIDVFELFLMIHTVEKNSRYKKI